MPASVTRAIELQAEFNAAVVAELERMNTELVGASLFAVDYFEAQKAEADDAEEQPAA